MKKLFLFIFFLPLISLNINAAQLTVSEADLLVQQLSSCWNIPSGFGIEKDMFVKISAKIYKNKRVEENSVRIVDTNISKNNPSYHPITEAALRIFYNPKCIPLYLPTDKYDLWKYITVTLDFNLLNRYQKNTAAKDGTIVYCKNTYSNLYSKKDWHCSSGEIQITFKEYNSKKLVKAPSTKVVKIKPKKIDKDGTIVYCKNTYSNLYSKKDWHCSSGEIQITFKEYNSKIIKKDFGIKIQKDLEGPSIIVVNTFQANDDLIATLKGRIIDSSQVTLLIDGDKVSMDWKGTFNKKMFVRLGGQDVKIIAIDQHGNISEETVKLVRAPSTQVAKIEPKSTTTETQIVKQEQTVVVEKDLEGPRITMNTIFEGNLNNEFTATIEGRITDQSKIVSLVIDGDEVSIEKEQFNKQLYVLPRGQQVKIIARDKHGNKSETTVQLVRTTVVIEEDKFDFLDPRKIKAKTNENAVALIIGVEEYKNTVAALFASKDAETFYDFARLTLGIPSNNIKLLTNNEAQRNDTLIALETWLPKKIIDNQTELYVFYAGHGLTSEDGSDLYLLPFDGVPEILEKTTLLRNDIIDIISNLNPKRVTMFFDTCYSGATRTEEVMIAARPIAIVPLEQDVPSNFNIFSASSGRETAKVLKEAEHGLFSYYMMKGLEGDADSNNDQTITNGELLAFIKKNVSRQADQTPQLNGNPDQVLVRW